jgi:hypothetical protein
MATAEGADIIVPLLHLRGTEYGLRIHGLQMGADAPRGPAVDGRPGDEALGGSDHG